MRPGRERALGEDEEPVGDEREEHREPARDDDLRLERLAEREEDRVARGPSGMTSAATVASAIVETTATRSPAKIAGTASGSSTRQSVCRRVSPIPRAASITSAGTPRSPSRMLR